MRKIGVCSVALFLTIQIHAFAENPCAGKPDSEIRLDMPKGTLENSKILDQDSVGVCYATAMATALQSAIPKHPDISYLDYAIEYKKAEMGRSNPKLNQASGSVLEGGGDFCELFGSIKKRGLCPRSKVNLEMAAIRNPELQVSALSGIGSFFDTQKNKTEAERKEVVAAIQKNLQEAREASKMECSQFPTEMRKLLSDLYFEWKQKANALKASQFERTAERASEEAKLEEMTKAELRLKSQWDEFQKQRGALKASLDADIKKRNPTEGSAWLRDRKLKWQEADIDLSTKQIEIQIAMLDAGSRVSAQRGKLGPFLEAEQRVAAYQKQMSILGEEVPDPAAKLSQATRLKLSAEVEARLKGDYFDHVSKSNPGLLDFTFYSGLAADLLSNLGVQVDSALRQKLRDRNEALALDKTQTNPSECLAGYLNRHSSELKASLSKDMKSCRDPKLVNASLHMLAILATEVDSKLNTESILGKLNESPWAFLESLIGSSCTAADRIKVPVDLSCGTRHVLDEVLNLDINTDKNAFDSPKITSRVGGELRRDSVASLTRGRAVTIGVCADFLYSSSADSRYGIRCNEGHHAIEIIGYRCKAGQGSYLIQNSWGARGSSVNPSYESDHGRSWIPENTVVRNISSYSILKGGGP